MSDMPDIKNGRVTVRIPVELLAKVRNGAREHRMDVTEYIRWILAKQLDKVPLTPADLEWINEQIEANRTHRRNRSKRDGN